jgi:hypothetical protein
MVLCALSGVVSLDFGQTPLAPGNKCTRGTVQIVGKYKINILQIATKHSEPVEEAAFANPHPSTGSGCLPCPNILNYTHAHVATCALENLVL